jgi:hypothetical protein
MHNVCICLIHNNNEEHNAYIRPRLAGLQKFLAGRYLQAQLFEVAYQSEIKPHSVPMAILRDAIYEALDRDWL